MARLIDQDYGRLSVFLNQYTLSEALDSKSREQLIKRGHKYCLAALQIWATAEQLAHNNQLIFNGLPLEQGSRHFEQFSESFSDLTSSFFAAIHGLYKPAHMALRSAIETSIRSMIGLYSQEAATTTSVYRLFELARACAIFSGPAAQYFNVLHQQYGQLCGFTHSSTPAHMAKNYALSSFPKQDIEALRIFVRNQTSVIKAMLAIYVLTNKSLYLGSSHQAQDIYEEVLPKDARLFALGAPAKT